MVATIPTDLGSVTIPNRVTDMASFLDWIESDEVSAKCKPWFIKGNVWIDTGLGALTIPRRVADIDSYLEWRQSDEVPEKLKVWYLKGDIWVDLSMEELFTHTSLKLEIARVLQNLAKESKTGTVFTDGATLSNPFTDICGEPDMMYISNATKKAGRVRLIPSQQGGALGFTGSPDIVLEVVSRSSVKKDNETLFEAYYEAGIPEYWLVDARGDEVKYDIYKRGLKGYVATRKQAGWLKSVVIGKSFKLVRTDDADGNPEFTLQVK